VDAWRVEYNTRRPHQSLDMATPAERFRPIPVEQRTVLGLWRPPELAPTGPGPDIPESPESIDDEPDEPLVAAAQGFSATDASTATQPAGTIEETAAGEAVEIDRIVPASGNLGVCGQQFWLGPARTGRTLTLWIDTTTVHLSIDGQHLKTLPSRLTSIDMARLRAQGARVSGAVASPASPPGQLAGEIEARVCELRRMHPRWGPRRLVHELGRLRVDPLPSRSTSCRSTRISAFFDLSCGPTGRARPRIGEDQIHQSHGHSGRSCLRSPAQRYRGSAPWITSSALTGMPRYDSHASHIEIDYCLDSR
jgi:hypothetical protein